MLRRWLVCPRTVRAWEFLPGSDVVGSHDKPGQGVWGYPWPALAATMFGVLWAGPRWGLAPGQGLGRG